MGFYVRTILFRGAVDGRSKPAGQEHHRLGSDKTHFM